jgi:hypothetical protein
MHFRARSTSSHGIAGVMIKVHIRKADWSNAACARRWDIIIGYLPPLLVAGANFAPALALEAVQVFIVRSALQGDSIGLVAILDRPLLLIAAIAFVLDDDAGRAVILLMS